MFSNNEDYHNHPSSSSSVPRQQEFHNCPDASQRMNQAGEPYQGETSDDSCQIAGGEKKRRLKVEQVKALVKTFDSGTKLDPDRKLQLARELGLQPRQVAIWFQNRRARWKTKKLEKDYDVLKRQVDSLRAYNDALKSQNKSLHSQLLAVKERETSEESGTCMRSHKHHNNSMALPSSNIRGPGAASLNQVLNIASRPDHDQFHGQEGNFSNVFGGNQPGFWPWPDQQSFH